MEDVLITRQKRASFSQMVTRVSAAFFLACALISFRINPVHDFASTEEMTVLSGIFQGIIFLLSLAAVFLFCRLFPKADNRLMLLVTLQFYLALLSIRSGKTAFAAGAVMTGAGVLAHGLALRFDADFARFPGTETAPRSKLRADDVVNRVLFIVLAALSALLPAGLAVAEIFFGPTASSCESGSFFLSESGGLWLGSAGASVVFAILLSRLRIRAPKMLRPEQSPALRVFLFTLALIPTVYLLLIMVARTASFYTPTYDMGIFRQMFHYMKTMGAPLTTLERDQLLSHFSVHISPIYYLLLPFYAIFPSAETLQVLQILVVVSALVPLNLLARRYFGRNRSWRLLVSVIFLLQPGLLGSSLYDLHENCFLAPLLLWLLYACHTRKTALVLVTAVLTLLIKEDAALYVVSIAFFLLLGGVPARDRERRRKDTIHGVILLASAPIYFAGAYYYLSHAGMGAMTYRYDNLAVYKNAGFAGILPAMLQNPAYYLSTMWSDEKIRYLLIAFGSLGFLPLYQKKPARYMLMVPLLVMNLLTLYKYQYNLEYQYHYGSGVLLVFLAVTALAEFRSHSLAGQAEKPALRAGKPHPVWYRGIVAFAAAFAVLCGMTQSLSMLSRRSYPIAYERSNRQMLMAVRGSLSQIPAGARVGATTFLTCFLSDRLEIYDLKYHASSLRDGHLDYLIIDRRRDDAEGRALLEKAESFGYVPVSGAPREIVILKWPK